MSKPKKKFINLDKNVHIKAVQWKLDMDYIENLRKKAVSGCAESYRALEFMNQYVAMELDNNFNNELGRKITKEQRSIFTKDREHQRFDVFNIKSALHFSTNPNELEDKINNSNIDIAEMSDALKQRAVKRQSEGRRLRKIKKTT